MSMAQRLFHLPALRCRTHVRLPLTAAPWSHSQWPRAQRREASLPPPPAGWYARGHCSRLRVQSYCSRSKRPPRGRRSPAAGRRWEVGRAAGRLLKVGRAATSHRAASPAGGHRRLASPPPSLRHRPGRPPSAPWGKLPCRRATSPSWPPLIVPCCPPSPTSRPPHAIRTTAQPPRGQCARGSVKATATSRAACRPLSLLGPLATTPRHRRAGPLRWTPRRPCRPRRPPRRQRRTASRI